MLNSSCGAINASAVNASALRNSGHSPAAEAVTSIDPTPPITTARTAPHHCAVTPLSNSPNSFEAPMNSQFTALTRPRISGGVANCSRLDRTTTLTMSLAPTITNVAALSHMLFDNPNTTVAAPNIPTQINMVAPAFRLIGFTTIVSETASAPTEGI